LNAIVFTRFALRYTNSDAALHETHVTEIQSIKMQKDFALID